MTTFQLLKEWFERGWRFKDINVGDLMNFAEEYARRKHEQKQDKA